MSADTNLREDALALCRAIERIPASEQQTEASILAAALIGRIDGLIAATDNALMGVLAVRERGYDIAGKAEGAMLLVEAALGLAGKPQQDEVRGPGEKKL